MKDNKVIISNQIECNSCHDKIWSGHVHDFVTCDCGNVNVDGGNCYMSRGWKTGESYTEQSIEFDKDDLESLVKDIELFKKTRNSLGVAYAMFRWFRDNDYIITKNTGD